MDILIKESHPRDMLLYHYKLYQDKALCDLIVLSQDDVVFNMHKIVLTASSKYLHQVFMNSQDLHTVKLDIPAEVIRILLEFVYTGQLFVSAHLRRNVIEAATFLQMYSVLELLNRYTDEEVTNIDSEVEKDFTKILSTHVNTVDNDIALGEQRFNSEMDIDQDIIAFFPDQKNNDLHNKKQKEQTPMANENKGVDTCKTFQPENLNIENAEQNRRSLRKRPNKQSPSSGVLPRSKRHQKKDGSANETYREVKQEKFDDEIRILQEQLDLICAKELEMENEYVAPDDDPEYTTNDESITSTKSDTKVTIDNQNEMKLKNLINETKSKKRRVNERTSKHVVKGRAPKDKNTEIMEDNTNVRKKLAAYSKKKVHMKRKNDSDKSSKMKTKRKRNATGKMVETTDDNVNISRKDESSHRRKVFVPYGQANCCTHCKNMYTSHVCLRHHKFRFHKSDYFGELLSAALCKKFYTLNRSKNCEPVLTADKLLFHCSKCRKHFTKYSSFTLHYRKSHMRHSKHSNGSWHSICNKLKQYDYLFTFAKKRILNKSTAKMKIKKQIPQRKIKCTECHKMFVSKATVSVHMKKIHKINSSREKSLQPEGIYACVICPRNLHTQYALLKHLEIVHHQNAKEAHDRQYELRDDLPCEVLACQFTARNLNTMKEHVMASHPFIKHQCPKCKMSYQVGLMLKRHIVSTHDSGRAFKYRCRHCDKMFPKQSHMLRHEFWKHGIKHDNIKVYQCKHPGCTYVTSAGSSLRAHQSKHTTEKLFTCDFCGLKLKTEVSHRKHVNKMHLGIRPYLCQVCGQSFGEDHELKSHIMYKHSTEREFQCTHCTYATSVKATYHTHLFNVHKVRAEDDKREIFSCPHCSFTSILHHRYKTHLNSHSGTREYHCNVCNKSFVSSSTLRAHKQWLHSEKIYSCTQCEYQTKTSQKLNEHIRVQHQLKGLKPYKCPYCDFCCATGGNTRKHVKQVHRGQVVTYIRDDSMINAARIARASGRHDSIVNIFSGINSDVDKTEAMKNAVVSGHQAVQTRVNDIQLQDCNTVEYKTIYAITP